MKQLDKQTKREYPTYARMYVRKYLSTLSFYTYLYAKLRYATYVTLRTLVGLFLFVVVVIAITVRFVARQFATHALDDDKQE